MFDLEYTPKYFTPDELAPKNVCEAAETFARSIYPDNQAMIDKVVMFVVGSMFDPQILKAIDWLREQYGTCIINNWKRGGPFQYRGLRQKASKYYREGSTHSLTPDRQVQGADCSFTRITAEEIRQDIRKREVNGESMPFTRVENEVTWIHVDVKPTGLSKVHFFNP
jgi:hypothetical protein